jgi:hypothetical protein
MRILAGNTSINQIFYFGHQNGSISPYAQKPSCERPTGSPKKMLLALQWLRSNPRESPTVQRVFISLNKKIRSAKHGYKQGRKL